MGPVYGWDKVRFTSMFNVNDVYHGGSFYFDKLLLADEMNDFSFVDEEWNKGWNYLK